MEINKSPTSKAMLVMAAVVIVLAGIKAASVIVIPLLLSAFIAIAVSPLINWSARYQVPRWLSISLVILFMVVIGFMLAGLITQSLADFRENMPVYREQLAGEFAWVIDKLGVLNIHLNQALIREHLDPGMAMSVATNFITGMGTVLSNVFLILLTVLFMLFEADSMPRRAHVALADPDMKLPHIDRFLTSVNQYLVIKMLVSLGTGIFIGVWLYVLGVDHFMLWAVLAFMLNFIPNIGSIIAAIPAIFMAFVEFGFAKAGLAGLGFLLVNTVMGNFIEPRFLGKGLGLSTLVVFLSLVFWGWLLGSVGMLLSVPLTMVVKIAMESREETRWLALLLSADVDTVPPNSELTTTGPEDLRDS
ncbi:AI-2E family transporter [Glaciecola sp. SC05]|uniref:AI-2E family transporter n=1 Tax=Glaciecola sp. SC05 TaxID=1987355 RepID=UPI003527525A